MDKKKVFVAAETIRKLFRDTKLSKEEGLLVLATSLCGFCNGNPEHIKITSDAMEAIAVGLAKHTKETFKNPGAGH